jgi:hypothetical protein
MSQASDGEIMNMYDEQMLKLIFGPPPTFQTHHREEFMKIMDGLDKWCEEWRKKKIKEKLKEYDNLYVVLGGES